jgi:hypothetical protein
MSDVTTQVAANTQASGDAQPVAGEAVTLGAGVNTSAPVSSAPATTSQQASEGQTAQGDKPAASSDGDQGAAAGDKPAAAPDKYEFKAPEGVTFDGAIIDEFSTVAKELGLPQDAAQKVIDKLAPTIAKQNAQAISAAMESANAVWVQATQTDKDIGGDKLNENLAVARKALDRFGTPELRKLLGAFDAKGNPTGTGLGNHPEIIRAFVKAGRAISEDKFVPGTTQPTKGEKNLAKSLYPNQPA